MKYVITKKIITGRGFIYDTYLQGFLGGASVSVMRIQQAKVYTSRKAAREDLKKVGDAWMIEKLENIL